MLPEPDCDEQFERVGCFRDNQIAPRPLPDYIMTDRQENLVIYSGQRIDWRNWDAYMPQFVCRCAKKAKEKGHIAFGVQFYGKYIKIIWLRLHKWIVSFATTDNRLFSFEQPRKKTKCLIAVVVISVRFHFASDETCLVNAKTTTTRANPKASHEVNAGSFFLILFLRFVILKVLRRVTNLQL